MMSASEMFGSHLEIAMLKAKFGRALTEIQGIIVLTFLKAKKYVKYSIIYKLKITPIMSLFY